MAWQCQPASLSVGISGRGYWEVRLSLSLGESLPVTSSIFLLSHSTFGCTVCLALLSANTHTSGESAPFPRRNTQLAYDHPTPPINNCLRAKFPKPSLCPFGL